MAVGTAAWPLHHRRTNICFKMTSPIPTHMYGLMIEECPILYPAQFQPILPPRPLTATTIESELRICTITPPAPPCTPLNSPVLFAPPSILTGYLLKQSGPVTLPQPVCAQSTDERSKSLKVGNTLVVLASDPAQEVVERGVTSSEEFKPSKGHS